MLGRVIETGPNRIVMQSGLFPFLAPPIPEDEMHTLFPYTNCKVVEVEVPSTHETLMAEAKEYPITEWLRNDIILGANAPIMFHYLHSDPETPQQVRFIANMKDAERGRWTSMLPGRYLTKFYPHVDAEVVKDMATRYMSERAPAEFCVVTGQDEIIDVYRKGPSSCMSHPITNYGTHIHPVAAYASPDIGIAYIRRGDSIVARSVVNLTTKQYTRVYGDTTRFETAAKLNGFTPNGSLNGCRLPVIHNERLGNAGYVVPYLDSGGGLVLDEPDEEGKQWFRIQPRETAEFHFPSRSTSGYIRYSERRHKCGSCSMFTDRSSMNFVHCKDGIQLWCSACAGKSSKAFYCNGLSQYVNAKDFKRVELDGNTYSSGFPGLVICQITGVYFKRYDAAECVLNFSTDFTEITVGLVNPSVKLFRRKRDDKVYFVPEHLLARWDGLNCQPQLPLELQTGQPTL